MKVNGEKRKFTDLNQWERTAMHDLPVNDEFPLGAMQCEQRSSELQESFGKLATAGMANAENHRIQPFKNQAGNSYEVTAGEWADTLARRAIAMRGISYAGEMPTLG